MSNKIALLLCLMLNFNISVASELEADLLILEVRLEQEVISSAIPAYELSNDIFIPLGELARVLSIAISTRPESGIASGFIITEERSFSLNLETAQYTVVGVTKPFDRKLALSEMDDIYVAQRLLERWLPITLDIDRSRQVMHVNALEELPSQAYLHRTQRAQQLRGDAADDLVLPSSELPYRLWSPPFIDQRIAVETLNSAEDNLKTQGRYTAHVSGDLLGMESSFYINYDTQGPLQDFRGTLSRYDPEGSLLGPLQARSVQLGSQSTHYVEHLARGASGHGVSFSNRPLSQPADFDRQTFEGVLSPGWDVELYYNGGLVGYQQPNEEGLYRFEDLPLSYGRNDFKLVFHGPLGQTRVEQQSFSLETSMIKPGEVQYNVSVVEDEDGVQRSVAEFGYGLTRSLSATAGVISTPVDGVEREFLTAGLRTFWQSFSLSADHMRSEHGGELSQLGVKTRLAGLSIDANRTLLQDFHSDIYSSVHDPLQWRDEVRIVGTIPVGSSTLIPSSLEVYREQHESGRVDTKIDARISTYANRTAFTNTLSWRAFDEHEQLVGALRASRRVLDMSIRAQMDYTLIEEPQLSMLSLSADKFIGDGYRLTMNVAHQLEMQETRYSLGFTKSRGQYGLAAQASYVDTGEMAANLQFFIALGHDAPRSNWMRNARPMATLGAASLRVFVDTNNNGIFDSGEQPIPGAGFTVDGARQRERTDAQGVAQLVQLPVQRFADVAIDLATLEDPQWVPAVRGKRFLPRPGRIAEVDIPVQLTTEIDGTVFLAQAGQAYGIAGLKVELLNEEHEVIAHTTTAWDGFFILEGVVTGEYFVRLSPEQVRQRGLTESGLRSVSVSGDGAFVSGINLIIERTRTH